MPEVVTGIWKPPPFGENQWSVTLGGLDQTVNALSHQKAKSLAIDYWASGSCDPVKFKQSLLSRINEKWRGGIRARLRHRGSDFNVKGELKCQS